MIDPCFIRMPQVRATYGRSNIYKSLFYEIKPNSWEEIKQIGVCLKQHSLKFCFRGHNNQSWRLKTSIERAIEKNKSNFSGMWMYENQIIEKFKTRAHQFIQSPPGNQDIVEWLSIIQHYGGPTRLLDFTESFYIASFFCYRVLRR